MTEPKQFKVLNFTNADEIRFVGQRYEKIGPLVSMVHAAGSMRFQHDMTTEQARKFAADLLLADEQAENDNSKMI